MRLAEAKSAALAAVTLHIQRLSERTTEKVLREKVFQHLPNKAKITSATPINVSIDVATTVKEEHDRLQDALDKGRLEEIVARYPIRETPALSEIAKRLGFKDREQYEGSVRKLLMDDDEALRLVRALFGTLEVDIDAA